MAPTYLPQAIKGSSMVVNENGNNSHVYPKNLKEYCGDLLGDGITVRSPNTASRESLV